MKSGIYLYRYGIGGEFTLRPKESWYYIRFFGSRRSAFYVEMGGEIGAFSGLKDLTIIGSPRLTVGFMLFGNQWIAPFRI